MAPVRGGGDRRSAGLSCQQAAPLRPELLRIRVNMPVNMKVSFRLPIALLDSRSRLDESHSVRRVASATHSYHT